MIASRHLMGDECPSTLGVSKTGEVRYVNRIILVVLIRLDDIGRQIISHANKYFGIFRCKRLLISELSPNDTHLW